jgi:hypothetical protein
VSKTISAAAVIFSDLLAIMPLLALPFLLGGVSFELFLATVLLPAELAAVRAGDFPAQFGFE